MASAAAIRVGHPKRRKMYTKERVTQLVRAGPAGPYPHKSIPLAIAGGSFLKPESAPTLITLLYLTDCSERKSTSSAESSGAGH